MLEPATPIPEASPRLCLPNHADTSPMAGTLLPAPPTPARKQEKHAALNDGTRPVSSIERLTMNNETEMTTRGPKRAASIPAKTTAIKISNEIPCLKFACLGIGKVQTILHGGQDTCVAESRKPQRAEDGQHNQGKDNNAIVQTQGINHVFQCRW